MGAAFFVILGLMDKSEAGFGTVLFQEDKKYELKA